MIQDYVIADQSGANFLADLNNLMAAIVSNNSSPTEPTTRFAYMWWVDTANNLLKQRNSSNSGWVTILNLTTGASVSTSINNLKDAVSDNLNNLGFGINVLKNNTTGSGNLALGVDNLPNNTTGYENVAAGRHALVANTTGYKNVAIGKQALSDNISGFNNIAIGWGSGATSTVFNNTITLGANTVPLGTDYITMGKNGGSDRLYNLPTANAVWLRVSDVRVKKDIQTNEDCGLAFINELNTVIYKFKAPSELSPEMSEYDKDDHKPSHDKPMYGFIAQEVKQALDKHNITNFAGHHQIEDGKDNLQGISYEMFVVPLVKAVQELSAKNQELEDKLNDMMERLEVLENKE